ncbi:hypothetical protein [Mariniflexile sp. HMF6888]|uniref:hypothetical protein n=1 Tax=Mariniflexile sp. HMF6888 TaxID=3373086 RepID=UPI00378B0F90
MTLQSMRCEFGLDDNSFSDQNTEHIIHAAMLGILFCFTAKTERSTLGGILMLAGMVYFYQKRK